MALQGWKRVTANVEYFSKSNNWLKMHNLPMRRKPLRKRSFFMDETYNMLGIDTRNRNALVLDIKNKARKRNVGLEIIVPLRYPEREVNYLRRLGHEVHIIDPEKEYANLADILGKSTMSAK